MAIDFGTTHCGVAYSRGKSSDIILKPWRSKTVQSFKTPTTLLLNKQNEFVAFGFDAEEMFKTYIKDETHENYRCFKNFKMKLIEKEVQCFHSLSIDTFIEQIIFCFKFHQNNICYFCYC